MLNRFITLLISFICFIGVYGQEATYENDSTEVMQLKEFVVKGSNLKQTPTGYIMSLSNQEIVKGKSTTELFNFMPNLTVMDEVISINGNAVTEIRLDGRRLDDYSILKTIPAQYIKSITVNLFAGADNLSSATGGTIEIELKPIASLGYYGQLQGNVTKALRDESIDGGVSGMIQARYKRFSVFESLMQTGNKIVSPTGYTYIRENSTEFKQIDNRNRYYPFQNYLAMNYEICPHHNLGLNWITFTNKVNSDYSEPTSDPDMKGTSKYLYNTLSLNYRWILNDNGDRINLSAEWLNHKIDERQTFDKPMASADDINYRQTSNLMRLEGVYMHKITDRHLFKAGAKYLQTHTAIHQLEAAQGETAFRETTIGRLPLVYASMEGFLGKFSYYAGLNWKMNRMEIKGQKTYTSNAFQPTVNISMPFGRDKNHLLSLSYKYMLDDVPYDAFNTRQEWVDPYIYSIGNPDIIAPTNHTLSLKTGLWNNRLNVSLNYKLLRNDIEWRTFSVPGSIITYQTPVNMPQSDSYSLTLNFSKELFDFWTCSIFASAGFRHDQYYMGTELIKNTSFRHIYFTDNSFSFGKGWGASLNATFDPGLHIYNQYWHTVWQINMAVSKMLFNNSLQLELSGTPARKHRRIDDHTTDMTIVRQNLTKPQQLTFSVMWFFNGGGNKNASVNVVGSQLEYNESKASNGL